MYPIGDDQGSFWGSHWPRSDFLSCLATLFHRRTQVRRHSIQLGINRSPSSWVMIIPSIFGSINPVWGVSKSIAIPTIKIIANTQWIVTIINQMVRSLSDKEWLWERLVLRAYEDKDFLEGPAICRAALKRENVSGNFKNSDARLIVSCVYFQGEHVRRFRKNGHHFQSSCLLEFAN